MEHRRLERDTSTFALLVVGAFAVAAFAAPATVQEHASALPVAYVDPLLRSSLAVGVPTPAILVLEPGPMAPVLSALDDLGLERHALSDLRMVTVLLDASTIDAVAAIPGVETVYRNERMHILLDQSVDYVGAKVVWSTYRTTGHGATILVMDSGIDGHHPDVKFRDNLIENVVPTRTGGGLIGGSKEGVASSDPDGHGTHVAAIAGGTGKALHGRLRGVAHDANIIGYQGGLQDPKSGNIEFESLTVLEGFNWALANRAKYGIDIVSNSWGANGEFDPRSPVNIATMNLYKSGVLVLFAAGNEGDDGSHTLNKYSVAPWVLSVTAGDYFNQVPSFASRGSDPSETELAYDHPDLVAPGVAITSARSLRGTLPPTGESAFYATKSGSSMATPHVAGVAALLLEANPKLSPDDLMDILTATATPLSHSPTWESGAGYVNALKAYQLAVKAGGHRDEFLGGTVKYAGPASGDAKYARDAVSVGYLKGSAHRLRSPDASAAEFVHNLVATPMGLTFLVGSVLLGVLAFGAGPRPTARATLLPSPGFAAAPAGGPPQPPPRIAPMPRRESTQPHSGTVPQRTITSPARSMGTTGTKPAARPLGSPTQVLGARPSDPSRPTRPVSARAAVGATRSAMDIGPLRPPTHARAGRMGSHAATRDDELS